MLDAVVDYLPNPMEVKPQPEVDLEGNATGTFALVDPTKPMRGLAFKIMDDRFGVLTFTRLYSGTLSKGDTILNTATGKSERVSRLVEMHANSREEIESAQAGDIIAIVGMKNVHLRRHQPADGHGGTLHGGQPPVLPPQQLRDPRPVGEDRGPRRSIPADQPADPDVHRCTAHRRVLSVH